MHCEEDDGVSEPCGHAYGPRGELVVEEEPPRAAAVSSVKEPEEIAKVTQGDRGDLTINFVDIDFVLRSNVMSF